MFRYNALTAKEGDHMYKVKHPFLFAVIVLVAVFSLMLAASAKQDEDKTPGDGAEINKVRHRNRQDQRAPDTASDRAARATAGTNGITYHGGPVILGTTNVYYIWYGNWTNNSAVSILTHLAMNIGGSPYFNINTTYTNSSNQHVSNSVQYKASAFDNYSHGKSLSDSAIKAIVTSAINSGALGAADSNGVYFVLTSSDVTATSGFCTQYCGWHTHGTIASRDIKYSFVGNAARCLSACAAQTTSPNGNAGADAMASILAHELEEAVTDPDLNAWYDSSGAENADKCAWTFGTTYTVSNGSKANMNLGGLNFLIQRNWVNASGGFCALKYP
jgi:hypothetical protein